MKLFTEYKSSLKMKEVEEIPDVIFYRPLAFLLVKLVLPTRITPNHLTYVAIIMGITGGFFYSLGTEISCIYGALFYLLFNILDCSDGQLARLKKNGTPTGRIVDGIADYTAAVAIFTGIAVGFTKNPDQSPYFLMLLALSGISIIIQEALVDYYRTRFMDYVLERKRTLAWGIKEYHDEYQILKNQKGKWFDKTVILIYLEYSDIQMRLAAKRIGEKSFSAAPGDYFRKNRIIIRFWVFMGPTLKITTLIVCSLFCRFDIYFWIVIGFFNLLCAIVWLIQRRIDKYFIKVQQ
jgi:phosphatidylglycerophosphate synthase